MKRYIAIPVYNQVLLPGVTLIVPVSNMTKEETARIREEGRVVLLAQKENKDMPSLTEDDFYSTGLLAELAGDAMTSSGRILRLRGLSRQIVTETDIRGRQIEVTTTECSEEPLTEEEEQKVLGELKESVRALLAKRDTPVRKENLDEIRTVHDFAATFAPVLHLTNEDRYALLQTDQERERARLLMQFLDAEKARGDEESEEKAGGAQADYQKKIEEAGMPAAVRKEVDQILRRYKQAQPQDPERSSMENYLDFVTALKWKIDETAEVDLKKAREILDRDHFGLKTVKERILQQIAVMALKKEQAGSILLLVGAPGTGKTSMGRSVAEALGRKYARISLGGVRDEAEIRGHRRTYIGAMPGRIMDGIKKSGAMNPVIVLDEIDKLSMGYQGDPASALLEVLDPEQNSTFTDHYMNVPYDLSNVFFICTANSLQTIPGPLLDRMEVISLSGYTPGEKREIAKKYLLPRAKKDAGLSDGMLNVDDPAIDRTISEYTMEAGVRGLKKQMDILCRRTAAKIVEGEAESIDVTQENLPEFLGNKRIMHDRILEADRVGVVTGLAWTPVGGEILFIETRSMHGSGRTILTGQLGDVMKESATISASLVRSLFGGNAFNFDDKDLHIHVPSGAVQKDGPSAGIALFTALSSLVTGRPVSRELAMTGEISLRGQVMPIGGLPEKLMAADRAGVKKVLIPQANVQDLEDVPQETRDHLTIIPVSTAEEVLKLALDLGPEDMEKFSKTESGKKEEEAAD